MGQRKHLKITKGGRFIIFSKHVDMSKVAPPTTGYCSFGGFLKFWKLFDLGPKTRFLRTLANFN